MKLQRFLFLGLSLAVMFLAGCRSENVNDSLLLRTFQGDLSTLATEIEGLDVTHVLVTEAKERVYLRSLLFDLDDYDGSKVRVFGPYSQEEVSTKPVNILTVEKIDLLSDQVSGDPELDRVFTADTAGVKFSYASDLFRVEQDAANVSLSSISGDSIAYIKRFTSSPELDYRSFAAASYPKDTLERSTIFGSYEAFKVAGKDSSKQVYILTRTGYFYEISFINLASEVSAPEFESFESSLATIQFIEIPVEAVPSDSAASTTTVTGPESTSTTPPLATDVDKKYGNDVINAFEKVSKNVLTHHLSTISYSFSNNNYFYVIYQTATGSRRALFSYTSSFNFTKVAEFVPGTSSDWELTSGKNVAFDRPLTLVLLNNGESKEVMLTQGYRYFESLPLGFGLQYPMNWYYSRSSDSYLFSDKPTGEGSILVSVTSLKGQTFSTFGGDNVSSKIKKSTSSGETVYYVDLASSVLKISGASSYNSQMSTMASTAVEIKD